MIYDSSESFSKASCSLSNQALQEEEVRLVDYVPALPIASQPCSQSGDASPQSHFRSSNVFFRRRRSWHEVSPNLGLIDLHQVSLLEIL